MAIVWPFENGRQGMTNSFEFNVQKSLPLSSIYLRPAVPTIKKSFSLYVTICDTKKVIRIVLPLVVLSARSFSTQPVDAPCDRFLSCLDRLTHWPHCPLIIIAGNCCLIRLLTSLCVCLCSSSTEFRFRYFWLYFCRKYSLRLPLSLYFCSLHLAVWSSRLVAQFFFSLIKFVHLV